MNDKFKQDDIVSFRSGGTEGIGKVCGIATTGQPVIGPTYIIEIIESNIKEVDYPFTHFACPEINLMSAEFVKKVWNGRHYYKVRGFLLPFKDSVKVFRNVSGKKWWLYYPQNDSLSGSFKSRAECENWYNSGGR